MYPTNTVSQIFSLSMRRTIYKCTLMYVYRIIAPSIHPNHHHHLELHYTSRTANFDTEGNKIPLRPAACPLRPLICFVSPPIFNTFLGPPKRHLELQYVPSTTYTVTQLNTTSASIATHTFSSSIGPPTPPLRPSVRSWDHQH